MFCFQIEGPKLMQYGFKDAIAKVGLYKFLSDLFWIGMFYHLYNQVCCSPSLNLYVPHFLGVQISDYIKLIFLIFFPNEHISIQLSRASFNTKCSNSNAI